MAERAWAHREPDEAGSEPALARPVAGDSLDGPSKRAVKRLRRVMLIRVFALVAVVVAALVLAYAFGWITVERVARWGAYLRNDMPFGAAALVFSLVFAVMVAIGFPATPFLVAGGLMFGTALGTVFNVVGALLGSAAGYLLARTIARGAITKILSSRGRNVLERSTGFAGILRMRLVPVIPMAAISYAAGVASVRFAPFVLASTLGMLPSAWSYAYLADSIVAGATGAGSAALQRIVIAGAFLLVLSIVPRHVEARRRRR